MLLFIARTTNDTYILTVTYRNERHDLLKLGIFAQRPSCGARHEGRWAKIP
jgi:hypothetical protein